MKKILKKVSFLNYALFIGIMFLGMTISLQSCKKEEGTVTVKNETGWTIWTDVTWADFVENYEKRLSDGSSYKYDPVPAGTIEIWIRFDDTDWSYNTEHLGIDEDMLYTWYLSRKKAANGCPFVLELPDGRRVVPELKVKH